MVKGIERISVTPRPNWVKAVEDIGFTFHTIENGTIDPTYWDEKVAYKLTEEKVDEIDDATQLLYQMCMSAVDEVVASDERMRRFAIPQRYWESIRRSWQRKDLDVYGRFDLTFDSNGKPKMYEFNADTPTSLFEAAAVQWYWLEEMRKTKGQEEWDQFNLIDERLVEAWQGVKEHYVDGSDAPVYFSAVRESEEDVGTVQYMMDTAIRAGIDARFIAIEDLGWNGSVITDLEENAIGTLFKLYPWEWLVQEEIGNYLFQDVCDLIEPNWKMLLSNKAITAQLWEMYPNHELLIPTYWTEDKVLGKNYVQKPIFSREGSGIRVVKDGKKTDADTDFYGKEGFIYQEYMPPLDFDGNRPVFGTWVVAGRSCGMGIREDSDEITKNTSRFIPHFFI